MKRNGCRDAAMASLLVLGVFLGMLIASPLVDSQSQPDQPRMQTYSMFEGFLDEIRLFFAYGDDRTSLNLEIRGKELNSAIANAKNDNLDEAVRNLENAKKRLQSVRETVSLDMIEEVKSNVEETIGLINNETGLPEQFDDYILEEEGTQLTAELTGKIFIFCKELAKEDYALMLREEKCNPETAPLGLQNELKELKSIQEKSFNRLMLDIRSCIDDPGTCNCDDVSDESERSKCRKMVALAVRCEYGEDEGACGELSSMKPVAESFVPDFLRNLFEQKSDMIDYDIEKSDVPPECYNENDKPECEQYNYLKEGSSKCWDDEGNFLEDECGGSGDKEPTMQESIPQCYDENNSFMEEKCGKITIVRDEEGLVNYIIGKEIDAIVENFENSSGQNTVDINGTEGQTMVEVMKEEIEGMEVQIKERTFANVTREVRNDNVVDGGNGNLTTEVRTVEGTGDGGLKPEVKNEIGTGDGGLKPEIRTDEGTGDGGLTPVVRTDVKSD